MLVDRTDHIELIGCYDSVIVFGCAHMLAASG
jgi:hypothetical protein